jgi:hypothetical protein
MFSIDQNCHSLWDVIPKLQALSARGCDVTHLIEDIDVAFTAMGTDSGGGLRLARERFHRSGGQDWGAALFYFEFLGRQPVEIRQWEPLTGMKTSVLARKLARSVDELYEEFSPGDNWQLIGPSYVGDRRHHRVIGDLGVAETAGFLRELFDRAEADMTWKFPSAASRQRLREWFDAERGRLEQMLSQLDGARLVDLYAAWLRQYLGTSVVLGRTSNVLACRPGSPRAELLEVFLRDYDLAAGLYNQAIEEAMSPLHCLRTDEGELPFYATLRHQGHTVRTGVFLRGREIRIGDETFPLGRDRRLPLERLRSAGIACLAGKALLLVMQFRAGGEAQALALPYRGSLYMATSHRLTAKLAGHGLLDGPLRPVLRVRFHLLDRLRGVETVIRLPAYLADCLGREEVPARALGEAHEGIRAEAGRRLEAFADAAEREKWQRRSFPETFERLVALDGRRRLLAGTDAKNPETRRIWKEIKTLQSELADRTLRQVARDTQAAELDYWDSRGALLPWCIALGGRKLYDEVMAKAETYEEQPGEGPARG